jgi:heat shock protein HspQ
MATQPNYRFDLGDEVKDKITGYRGIVICRTEWLNACRRYYVQPQTLKDGKPIEALTFDEDNLEIVKAAKVVDKGHKPTGGDRTTPSRSPDPRR